MGANWGEQTGAHPFGQISAPPAPPSRPWGLIGTIVGLVVAIVLLVGYIVFAGGSASPAPTATPIAGSPTTSTGATSSPGPTVAQPDIAAQIDDVIAQMPAVRELDALEQVPYLLLTRDEARAELEALVREETDLAALAAEQRLLARLGLLPDDADLLELLIELQGGGVAAYYRTDTSTMYIVERDEPFSALDRVFVAHEYTHALQDQHFDLETNRITDLDQTDAAIAQRAAIEGDASLAMLFWAFGNLDPAEQLELLADMSPTDQQLLEGMPPVLRRQLTFPYSEGVAFSTELYALGGWDAINETITNPPASTEQVLHPQKYRDGELPIEVALADFSAELGTGWSSAFEQTMGELNLQIWLADGAEAPLPGLPGLPVEPEPWQDAAAGWGGDRLEMYESATDDWAIIWQIAWDSAAEAAEFVALAEDLRSSLDGVSEILTSLDEPWTVTLLVASDEMWLEGLSPRTAD